MKWIWCSRADGDNQYLDFYRDFTLDATSADAELQIAADSEYVVYLNGTLVSCGQYDDFPHLRTYDKISVAPYLKQGENTLTISLSYQGKTPSYQYAVGDPGLCYRLQCGDFIMESDAETLSAPSDTFVSGKSVPRTTVQYGYGFICDSRGTGKQAFTRSEEHPLPPLQERPVLPCVLHEVTGRLLSQGVFRRADESLPIGKAMQTDFLSYRPASELDSENAIYLIYDLGEETAGYFTMELDADAGTVVDIGYGEHLDDMRVRTAIGNRCFANRYICKDGKQTFTYYFRRIAGRYIELHISGTVRKVHKVGLIASEYPLTDCLTVRSTDSLWNKIIDVCKRTLKLCMHEHYEDSPWREQALYGSDARNQMLFGYYAFREYRFPRASLALLAESLGEDGFIAICAPTDNSLKIPSFTYIWMLAMKEYIAYSGDRSLAQKYCDALKHAADLHLSEIKPDGIACLTPNPDYWNFYEWSAYSDGSAPLDASVADGLYQVFLYLGLMSLAEIFAQLGEDEYSRRLSTACEALKNAVNRVFYDKKAHLYTSFAGDGQKPVYSELMQYLALYTGIADEHSEELLPYLTGPENNCIKITMSYAVYKYDVLLSHGSKYVDCVYREITEKWGNMLLAGATSFWETEQGADDFDGAGSLCHGWSASPLYIFARYCLGMDADYLQGTKTTPNPNCFEGILDKR